MENRPTMSRLRNSEKDSTMVPRKKRELCHRNILAGGQLAGENYLKCCFPRQYQQTNIKRQPPTNAPENQRKIYAVPEREIQ